MNRIMKLLQAILLAGTAVLAQQSPAYRFTTVLRPGTTIAGHTFDRDTISSAVINDRGEVAFVARWKEYGKDRAAVFTLHRTVASDGENIDGKIVSHISPNARLAINASGVVAYEAFTGQDPDPSIYVERRFILTPPLYGPDGNQTEFTLADNEEIVRREPRVLCPETLPNGQRASSPTCSPLSILFANRSGRIVIPLNTEQGPFLLAGIPVRH